MSESLRDQLLKAGLAKPQKANQARQTRGKKKAKKNRNAESRQETGDQAATQPRAEPVAAPAPPATKKRSAPRQTGTAPRVPRSTQSEPAVTSRRRDRSTISERIAAVIAEHGVERAQGEVPYRFVRGKRIKEAWVGKEEQRALAQGELALIAAPGDRYALLPAPHINEIRTIDPGAILVLVEPTAEE